LPFTSLNCFRMRKLYLLCSLLSAFFGVTAQNVPDSCRAEFTVQQQPGNTAPFVLVLTATAANNHQRAVTSVCWNFGDGTSSCSQGSSTNPASLMSTHTYTAAGTYNICVTISFEGGCQSNFCRSVVLPAPNTPTAPDSCRSEFIFLTSNTIAPAAVAVQAQPWHNNQRPVTRVCWNWNDGTPLSCSEATATSPAALAATHTYAQPGNFNICVSVTYDGGCVSTFCRQLVVTSQAPDSCAAHWFELPNNPSTPLLRNFSYNHYSSTNRPVLISCWNFGDGTPQICQTGMTAPGALSTNHPYTQPGNYNVCLTLNYDGGCQSTDCRQLIVAVPTPTPDTCHANFAWAVLNAGPVARVVGFTPQAAHNHQKPVTRICWEFGDGHDTCINYSTAVVNYGVQHTYATPGTYNACVTISYEGGCSSHECHAVILAPPADSCRAGFTPYPWYQHPNGVGLYANPWHNNLKPVLKVCWQFGDGRDTCYYYPNGYNNQSIFHQYPSPGTYNNCVTIFYQGGCQSTECHPVIIPPPPADSCRASYILEPVVATPLSRRFVAQPWHNNGKRVTSVCWQFGDGRDTCIQYAAASTVPYTATHAYTAYGTYNVCVIIHYEGGCQSTYCHAVIVLPPPPPPPVDTTCQAYFVTMNATSATALMQQFMAVPQTNRRAVRVCWYYGDGQSACIPQPNPPALTTIHIYAAPGNYQVCVRIEYEGGCQAMYCRSVLVVGPGNCTTSFTDTALTNRIWRFRGQGTTDAGDSIVSWKWTFGDGISGYGREIQHVYQNGGTYTVCLIARTRLGCEARTCRSITVNAPQVPLLTLHPNPVVNVLHVNFHALIAGNAVIRVMNASGLVVRTETRYCFAGMNFWTMNVASLPTGYYTLMVQAPNQYASGSFFKQ
jgi:PKD repeat protein